MMLTNKNVIFHYTQKILNSVIIAYSKFHAKRVKINAPSFCPTIFFRIDMFRAGQNKKMTCAIIVGVATSLDADSEKVATC